jgi:hypothetical protein
MTYCFSEKSESALGTFVLSFKINQAAATHKQQQRTNHGKELFSMGIGNQHFKSS